MMNAEFLSDYYKPMFEVLPGLYLILTPTLHIAEVNQAYLNATMTVREKIIGKHLFEVFPDNPDDPSADGTKNLGASLERALATQRADIMPIQKYDVRKPDQDGGGFEERFWSPINTPVIAPNGEVAYIVHRVEDVTEFMQLKNKESAATLRAERMEAELFHHTQQLQKANAELHQANEDLAGFSYSVSHDLRAPLRALIAYSTILKTEYERKLEAGGQDYLTRITSAAEKMNQLVNGLLSLAQFSQSRMNRQDIDLSKTVSEIFDELKKAEPERTIEFIVAPQVHALGDIHLIDSVLTNLLSNAVKFTKNVAHAKIEFGVETQNESRVFFVRDNGAGFDMKYQNKLFKTFERLHSPKEFTGIGIGLATVDKIIRRHGGTIWAEGKEGLGATFYFTL